MFRKILTFPSRQLKYVLPAVIIAGLVTGYFVDTAPLRIYMLPVIMYTVYPSMIGFRLRELMVFGDNKLLLSNLLLNFTFIPLVAYITGNVLLKGYPELYTGLIIISVIPGGNMIIAFVMLFNGNIKAAVKLTTASLVAGSILAPVYLYIMVGKYVPVDIINIFKNIAIVVFVPMTMGIITYTILMKKYSVEDFNSQIRPLLPGFSSWGLMYIIFTSISIKAKMIISYPELLAKGLTALLVFYLLVYVTGIMAARTLFNRADGITLVLSMILRNLAIAIGLAASAFGPQTTMMVALAFLIQQQSAVWFNSLNKKYGLVKDRKD